MNDPDTTTSPHRFSVAPMMERTDRHFRMLARLMSRDTRLYTEMIVTGAILKGDRRRFLEFNPRERPLALQLGGSDPAELARCARIAEDWGYDEVNLNVGCPSDRVKSGRIGACLMAEPDLVADCLAAMAGASALPVTVKCRIGIDDQPADTALPDFVARVRASGCRHFIVHARKAWLKGLSPRQNRELPPLDYQAVYRLKVDNPELTVVINGGIGTLREARTHLERVDGAMVGRRAYADPAMLLEVDGELFGRAGPAPDIDGVLDEYCDYMGRERARGTRLKHMARHLLGLFGGRPGARAWRRELAEGMADAGADVAVVRRALEKLSPPRAA